MQIDLHIHTTYSDGEKTPRQILDICEKKNMKIISITDHNNINGVKEAIRINSSKEITIIPGIELSAKYRGGQLHILGYNLCLDNVALNHLCTLIMEDNLKRIQSLVENLFNVYKISFKDEELQDVYNFKGNIGRPQIAKLCVKYGYSSSVKEAFKTLFNPIKDRIIKRTIEPTAKECIDYILKAGGIVSLAHAITLNKEQTELKKIVKELTSYGLSAIEIYHISHSLAFSKQLLQIADELNLLCSAGSDYHGHIVKPNIDIGEYSKEKINESDITIISSLLR